MTQIPNTAIESIQPTVLQSLEKIPPGSLAVVLGTFYPKWVEGERAQDDYSNVDKIRGDLAIETVKAVINGGHRCVIVDGASPESLLNTFRKAGAIVLKEEERGMSASRQQGFKHASEIEGVSIIAHMEPEKVKMAKECLLEAAQPILKGEADVVIPERSEEGFNSLPGYQKEDEQLANAKFTNVLKLAGLLDQNSPDIDFWFGPRLFRNDPELVQLFLRKYKYNPGITAVDKKVRPDLWPNATVFPISAAMHAGCKVVSQLGPGYRHPEAQVNAELDPKNLAAFIAKRKEQQRGIVHAATQYIRFLLKNPLKPTRLELIS